MRRKPCSGWEEGEHKTISTSKLQQLAIRAMSLVYRTSRYSATPTYFFFNGTATTEIYTLSLHGALPILLDEETGEYNVSYVQRYLAGRDAVIMNLVYREQGLIVPPGNPKKIHGLEDL